MYLNIQCTCTFSPAVMGEDYRRVSHVLVFTPNTISPLRVYVPLLNDDCLEYDEYFFVVASTNMDCVNLDDDNVTIHILDDDGKSCFSIYTLN